MARGSTSVLALSAYPHAYTQSSSQQMLAYLSSFAAVGFGVRCYQLAIMKRNIFENMGGHALSTAAFTGLGYYLYNADIRQKALIEDKREQLLRMREREARLAEANAETEPAHH